MGLKKIIKKLSGFLDEESSFSLTEHCAEIAELLEKLEKKRSKLENKLAETSKGSKRKSLKLDLKLTEAELKKGQQLMREKCSELAEPESAPEEVQDNSQATEADQQPLPDSAKE